MKQFFYLVAAWLLLTVIYRWDDVFPLKAAPPPPGPRYDLLPKPMQPILRTMRAGQWAPDLEMPDMARCKENALALASMPSLSIVAFCMDRQEGLPAAPVIPYCPIENCLPVKKTDQ